jgi:hypothetical protein
MVIRLLAIALLAGCADEVVVVAPVIDSPPPGSPAAAFPDVDEIRLSTWSTEIRTTSRSSSCSVAMIVPRTLYGENL